MTIGIIVLAFTMTGAPPALQTDTRPAAPTAQVIKDEAKPICRRYAEMGSNIRRRQICMNKDQWDAMARRSQATGRSMMPALTVPGAQ